MPGVAAVPVDAICMPPSRSVGRFPGPDPDGGCPTDPGGTAPTPGPHPGDAAEDWSEFPKCLCSDLMLCQVPGRAAWYEAPSCDMTIYITPPGPHREPPPPRG